MPVTIHCESADLAKALRDVVSLAKKSAIPATQSVLVQGDKAAVTLTTSNLDQQLARTFDAQVKGVPAMCVDAVRLSGVASALEQGSMCAMTFGEGEMILTSGRSRFRFAGLPATDFPMMPKPEGLPSIVFGEDFLRALDTVRHAVSVADTGWMLQGASLSIDGKVSATDSKRMARVALGGLEGHIKPIIIPTISVDLIRKLGAATDKAIRVEFGEGKIWADFGGTTLASKLVDGVFPDIDRIIAALGEPPISVKVNRIALLSALSRIMIIADGKDRGVRATIGRETFNIANRPSNPVERLENGGSDSGAEDVPCESDGEVELSFRSAQLRDALEAMRGDTVTFGLKDAISFVLMRSRDDETLMLSDYRG